MIDPSARGMLIVLSGPSGSGKGTIIKSLLSSRKDTVLSISVTTRQPRPGEIDGIHYFFRTRDEFEKMFPPIPFWNTPTIMETIMEHRRNPLKSGWQKAKMCCWKSKCRGQSR